MKLIKLLLLAVLALSPSLGMAQTSFFTDRAVGVSQFNGFSGLVPISYGQVRVCTYPTIGSPCVGLASITDINGVPLVVSGGNFGQLTTDIVGRFSFGCTPGVYQIQVAATGSNTPQLNYPITCSNYGISGAVLAGNNTWTGTNNFTQQTFFGSNGISTIAGSSGVWGVVPLGPDFPIKVNGPADVVVWSNPYITSSSTAVGGAGVATIVVASTASFYTNFPDVSGFPTSLYINRFQADAEALLAGTTAQCAGFTPPAGKWCIKDATHLTANFARAHASTPYTIDQSGSATSRSYVMQQTAQDGTALWFCQQDGGAAPYKFSCWIGNAATAYLSFDGTNTISRANTQLSGGTSALGIYWGTTNGALQTGTGDVFIIRDGAAVQQAKFSNTQTDLPAKVTLGGITTAQCSFKGVAGPVIQARLADDSGDCPAVTATNFTAGTLTSTVGIGTAPLVVTSTTIVPNLNASLWKGLTNLSATDSPGALVITAATCTDRSVAMSGLLTTAVLSVAANYALEANLSIGPAQAVAGTAHYRICNVTAGNITLAAGSAFNIKAMQ